MRPTIGLLVYDSSRKETTQTPGMWYFVHKGLRLDFLRASNQRFLGEPRATLDDSIELFAIGPLRVHVSLKNMTSCSKLSTEEFVRI